MNNLHDLVIRNKKTLIAIDIIKEAVPYFEDIRKTDDGLFVILKDVEKPLPLSIMGDGFISLLKIIFLTTLAENGIILLEGPEISQHPSLLDLLAESIVINSDKAQFFLTTHSLDLVNLLLEHGKRKNILEKINIIKLHGGIDNKVYLKLITGKDAKDEVDSIDIDLRGA